MNTLTKNSAPEPKMPANIKATPKRTNPTPCLNEVLQGCVNVYGNRRNENAIVVIAVNSAVITSEGTMPSMPNQ